MNKKPDQLLRNRITIRLDDEQYGRLLDYSSITNQNINVLVRKLIDRKIPKSVNPKDIQQLIRSIDKVGTNINQISKIANTYHTISDNIIEQLQNEIFEIKKLVIKELIEDEKIESNWYLK